MQLLYLLFCKKNTIFCPNNPVLDLLIIPVLDLLIILFKQQ